MCALPERAYAYVDPSVMTYTIQAVAGVAVALSAVAGVFFRRTRKALFKVLGIDENASKQVESPFSRITPDQAAALDSQLLAGTATSDDRSGNARPSGFSTWRKRFGFALVFAFALSFTVFIAPPLEIVGGNEASLTFGLREIWWIPIAFGLVVALALALALSALRGRAFSIGLVACACVAVAAYVQALALNVHLPVADGVAMAWFDYKRDHVISTVAWIAIIGVPLFLSRKNRERWIKPLVALMAVFVLVQGVGVASVFAKAFGTPDADQERIYVTSDKFLELSSNGNNVVVFVLDTLDNAYMRSVLAENPSWLEPLEGFTYFQNATGSMIPTCYGVPFLLSGQTPEHGEDFHAYISRRYASSSYLDDLHAAGWSVGLYTDSVYEGYGTTPEIEKRIVNDTVNLHTIEDANIDVLGALGALEQLALYRDAPWPLKPLFWFYTSDLNNRMIKIDNGTDLSKVQYILDDHRHLNEVRERGLALVDDGYAGSFRFIHLTGAHYPYNIDANGNLSALATSVEDQTQGSMLMVYAYLDEMKRLGVYDDATVIITTDHGHYAEVEPLEDAAPIAMLVKPGAGVADRMGAANYRYGRTSEWGVQVSDMPVAHGDVLPTVICAIGLDPTPYGQTFFQIDDPNRVRHYINTLPYNNIDHDFGEYEIVGDANDFANWHSTGETWQKRDW